MYMKEYINEMNLIKALKRLGSILSKFRSYEETKETINLSLARSEISTSAILQEDLKNLIEICLWLTSYKINQIFSFSIAGEDMLFIIDRQGPFVDDQVFNQKFIQKLGDDCHNKIFDEYVNLMTILDHNSAFGNQDCQELAKHLSNIFFSLCDECNKNFDLKIEFSLNKKDIEKAILLEVPSICDCIDIMLWLKEDIFKKFLSSNNVIEVVNYLSRNEKIPTIVIPNSELMLKSKYFNIIDTWSNLDEPELQENYDLYKELFHQTGFLPPSVFFQDQILESEDLMEICWKPMVYLILSIFSDYRGYQTNEKINFELEFNLVRRITNMRVYDDKIELGSDREKFTRNDIDFSYLKLLNEEYMKTIGIHSLKKAWNISLKEILGFKMELLFKRKNVESLIVLHNKLVDRAFDSQFEKLVDLIIRIEESASRILSQVSQTIRTVSTEVHNSSITVLGALVVDFVALLSENAGLVWFLGTLLITLLITFYIPMVNRKINGMAKILLSNREVYTQDVENVLQILDFPESSNFSQINIFKRNIDNYFNIFKESVISETDILHAVSIILYVVLCSLALMRPDDLGNKIETSIIFMPLLVIVGLVFWKVYMDYRYFRKIPLDVSKFPSNNPKYLKEISLYNSNMFFVVSILITLIYVLVLFHIA